MKKWLIVIDFPQPNGQPLHAAGLKARTAAVLAEWFATRRTVAQVLQRVLVAA